MISSIHVKVDIRDGSRNVYWGGRLKAKQGYRRRFESGADELRMQ